MGGRPELTSCFLPQEEEVGLGGRWERMREWNKQSTEVCLVGSAHGLFQSLEC